jgi:hypothetical protein
MSDDDRQSLQALVKHFGEAITDWEGEFLESVRRRLDAGLPLTSKMRLVFDDLVRQHLGKGTTISEEDLWK